MHRVSHAPCPMPASPSEAQDARQDMERLRQENRWLRQYLGETLDELHALQQRMYGAANKVRH